MAPAAKPPCILRLPCIVRLRAAAALLSHPACPRACNPVPRRFPLRLILPYETKRPRSGSVIRPTAAHKRPAHCFQKEPATPYQCSPRPSNRHNLTGRGQRPRRCFAAVWLIQQGFLPAPFDAGTLPNRRGQGQERGMEILTSGGSTATRLAPRARGRSRKVLLIQNLSHAAMAGARQHKNNHKKCLTGRRPARPPTLGRRHLQTIGKGLISMRNICRSPGRKCPGGRS